MQEQALNDQVGEWIQSTKNGDDDAFTNIVDLYQQNVYNMCYRMLGTPQEAEDAAQEAFWRAYQALNRYDSKRPFLTWLLSIAAHYCIDQQRKRKFLSFSIDELPETNIASDAPLPETAVSSSDQEKHIQILLNSMKPIDKAVLIMRYWHECSEKEIAESLSISISAVKSRLHRARKILAQKWEALPDPNLYTERKRNESSAL